MSLEANANVVEVVDLEPITIGEVVDLEPITIGEVTEVTGGARAGTADDNIVWGT